MVRIRLVFSDIDGTVVHKIYDVRETKDELILIGKDSYVDRETVNYIELIKSYGIPFIFITSRRSSTYKRLSRIIKPSMAVVEDGSVILDENDELDKAWLNLQIASIGPYDHINQQRRSEGELWMFKQQLAEMKIENLKVIDEGFIASFKVELPRDKPLASVADVTSYLSENGVEVPNSIRYSFNSQYNSLVFSSGLAGKANAARYLLNRYQISADYAAVLGDDYNDEELLRLVKYPMVSGSAKEEIRQVVAAKKDGLVVAEAGLDGTKVILRRLISLVQPTVTYSSGR